MSELRVGIAGTGKIAGRFAADLIHARGVRLVAVGSRSTETAERFGETHDVPRRHGSYAALAADPDVDLVYVATPQSRHEEDTIALFEAGKHVLCEKPLALNEASGARMIAAAKRAGRFLMEAVWSRFHPSWRELRARLASGAIGQPRLVQARFGFDVPFDPQHRLFQPALGGGALLDLGLYPVNLASMVLGAPTRVSAVGTIGPTGVDEQTAALLDYESGAIAMLYTALRTPTPVDARIVGTDGSIDIPPIFHKADSFVVNRDGTSELVERPLVGNGLHHQVDEVVARIRAGERESPVMSWEESLSVLRVMDSIRAEIGLVFPGE